MNGLNEQPVNQVLSTTTVNLLLVIFFNIWILLKSNILLDGFVHDSKNNNTSLLLYFFLNKLIILSESDTSIVSTVLFSNPFADSNPHLMKKETV